MLCSYITFSQQVVNCDDSQSTYDWQKTILPNIVNGTFVCYPFPKGVCLIKSQDFKEVLDKKLFNEDTKKYVKQFDECFSLNSYTLDGEKVDLFNDTANGNQSFQRELPGYISFTLMYNKDITGGNEYKNSATQTIKKIILYK